MIVGVVRGIPLTWHIIEIVIPVFVLLIMCIAAAMFLQQSAYSLETLNTLGRITYDC